MKFKQYDTARIVEVCSFDAEVKSEKPMPTPKRGDIAAIVEIYTEPAVGYELECCDENGVTRWLATFEASEIVMEKIGIDK